MSSPQELPPLPFQGTFTLDSLQAWIDERIAQALKAERERVATCFDHMSNAAYYDAQYDVSSAFEAAARELRE